MDDVKRIKIEAIHLDQDDPRKCTAKKLERAGLIRCRSRISYSPKKGILLNPLGGTVLSPSDKDLVIAGSLVALDCSWKRIVESVRIINKTTRLKSRALPVLLAGNPVSWGRRGRLSTVEALSATLFILGLKKEAAQILRPFKFGSQFMTLNMKPLEAYSECKTKEEVEDMQWNFFDPMPA